MKLMGLSGWLHWLAWFIKYFTFVLVSVSIETVLFCANTGAHGSVVGYSSPSVVFVFLLLYGVATISFCFAVSTFFSKGSKSMKFSSTVELYCNGLGYGVYLAIKYCNVWFHVMDYHIEYYWI